MNFKTVLMQLILAHKISMFENYSKSRHFSVHISFGFISHFISINFSFCVNEQVQYFLSCWMLMVILDALFCPIV